MLPAILGPEAGLEWCRRKKLSWSLRVLSEYTSEDEAFGWSAVGQHVMGITWRSADFKLVGTTQHRERSPQGSKIHFPHFLITHHSSSFSHSHHQRLSIHPKTYHKVSRSSAKAQRLVKSTGFSIDSPCLAWSYHLIRNNISNICKRCFRREGFWVPRLWKLRTGSLGTSAQLDILRSMSQRLQVFLARWRFLGIWVFRYERKCGWSQTFVWNMFEQIVEFCLLLIFSWCRIASGWMLSCFLVAGWRRVLSCKPVTLYGTCIKLLLYHGQFQINHGTRSSWVRTMSYGVIRDYTSDHAIHRR